MSWEVRKGEREEFGTVERCRELGGLEGEDKVVYEDCGERRCVLLAGLGCG